MEDLKKEVVTLRRTIEKQNKLLEVIAKALYLVPVTEKDVLKIQGMRKKNEQIVHEAYHNATKEMSEEDTASLFRPPVYEDADIYNDVVADDLLGGIYEAK